MSDVFLRHEIHSDASGFVPLPTYSNTLHEADAKTCRVPALLPDGQPHFHITGYMKNAMMGIFAFFIDLIDATD